MEKIFKGEIKTVGQTWKKGQKRPNAQNGHFLKYAQICNCGHFLHRLRTILKYEKILKMGNFEIMDNVK